MALRIVFGKLLQLAIGGILGAILGAIITGDPNYSIAWALGFGVVIVLTIVYGALLASRRRRAATAPAPTEAVLNPVSAAQPSAGVVLNGVPTNPAPARSGAEQRPLWWRVLSIATIVAGAGLALIPALPTASWIAGDIAAGRPFDGRDMRTGLHLQEAFDELVGVIGGTEVTRISFYADSIEVTAPTVPGDRHVDRYIWEYGRAHRLGADYTQPDDIREELFDAAAIDMAMVAGLVRDAKADSGIRDLDAVYPFISRFAGEEPEITISMSGTYDDAHYTYTLEGELIERYGSAFEG